MIEKVAVTAFMSALTAYAATWTGQIADSACGSSHGKMMAEHTDLKTKRDRTLACIAAGSKYVFVSDGKIYNISNQELAALKRNAGATVAVTGTLKGDTITVSKIAAK